MLSFETYVSFREFVLEGRGKWGRGREGEEERDRGGERKCFATVRTRLTNLLSSLSDTILRIVFDRSRRSHRGE